MGVNNLKWDDAIAVLDRYFSDEEKLAGWSESFTTRQIAALQRPHKWIGTKSTTACVTLFKKLNDECRIGAIPAIKQEILPTVNTPIFTAINSSKVTAKDAYFLGEARGKNLVEEIVSKIKATPPVEIYRVTVRDFMNWLNLQGEMPSVHVQAWFDAVLPPDQISPNALATTAPAVKPVQRSAAQDATIIATLQSIHVDPLAIPKKLPGMPGTKAKVRAALNGNPLFTGTTVFNKAWERLLRRREIVNLT